MRLYGTFPALLGEISVVNSEIPPRRDPAETEEVSNISNTRKSVSSGYPNPEKCVEKRGRRPSFLTTSRCLDILMKHTSE